MAEIKSSKKGQNQKIDSVLDMPVQYLKGVGPKRAALFSRIGVATVRDLLYLKPRKYLNRKDIKTIRDAKVGEEVTISGEIVTKGITETRSGKLFKVILKDDTGWLELVWFHLPQLEYIFKVGDTLIASGKLTSYRGIKQLVHPEYEIISEGKTPWRAGRIIPVYPATEGLKPRFIHRIVETALEKTTGKIKESLPTYLVQNRGLLKREIAIRKLHLPDTMEEAEKARKSIAYEEFLYFYLNLLSYRVEPDIVGIPLRGQRVLTNQFLRGLPFELTGAQKRVIGEIEQDIKKDRPMHRLLQGDVGSGKTVIALYSMLRAVESGYQACIMAPTEILAEQHHIVISEMVQELNVPVILLTGKMRKKEKEKALQEIKEGRPSLIVGTHALIQEEVNFPNLALAIVDEQHRFGVLQRGKLREKGAQTAWPHFLVMTATPIPRTLAMTLYGDLDISILDEKPPGRTPIVTKWVRSSERAKVYRWLFKKIAEGNQAYVVAPLIEKSEKLEAEAAIELHKDLTSIAPEGTKVSLIHGRMKRDERREVMARFRDGDFQILVATTVIEVGIDVPNATIMIIEHAERFGLAQLHQLRGRVGRGAKRSYCILITKGRVTDETRMRLTALVKSNDGFEIAEVDLKIRGPGQVFGTRQHGLPEFKVGDIIEDREILLWAREDAKEILKEDPTLSLQKNEVLKERFLEIKRRKVLYVA